MALNAVNIGLKTVILLEPGRQNRGGSAKMMPGVIHEENAANVTGEEGWRESEKASGC